MKTLELAVMQGRGHANPAEPDETDKAKEKPVDTAQGVGSDCSPRK